ncbi:MAG: response regulator [Bacteroidetes bacterium]|nr:response regulator [Candidatus Colenecus caballi]
MEYEALNGLDGSKYTVMIVDDIPINTRLLEKILSKANFRLRIFNDSQLAMDNIAEIDPDILLMDVMMPGIDGFTFLTRLRSNPAFDHVRVVLVTAVSESEEILRAGTMGANDYITKPINAKRVASSIAAQIQAIEAARNK